jgi:glycosyltransferase involved in cell wall biosynthesis
VNGAALTSREFVEYGKRNGNPVLTLHPHTETRLFDEGSVRYVELQRSLATVPVETDFGFDTLMWRYKGLIEKELEKFQPDIIHVVSPGDLGLLSIVIARKRKLPIILGYHTNLHEFARHRLEKALSFLPQRFVESAGKAAEDHSLSLLLQLYKLACASLAPNREYTELLEKASGKRSFVMTRGVDTVQFDPAKRTRTDDDFVIGFVGRLQPEKNVRTLAEVEKHLLDAGLSGFRFLIVGSGGEQTSRTWSCPACCGARRWRKPTPTWTCSRSPPPLTPSATWCRRPLPRECPPLSRRKGGRNSSFERTRPALSPTMRRSSRRTSGC